MGLTQTEAMSAPVRIVVVTLPLRHQRPCDAVFISR
jgi:hypothetical protein